jgi:thiosulfate/3-mercaptopyruvate sulfurtransferase
MIPSQRAKHLAKPSEIEPLLGNPQLVLLDVRGEVRVETDAHGVQRAEYVGLPDVYAEGHIPGAIFVDWTRDIVDAENPVPAQLASFAQLESVFGACGIGEGVAVVAYDDHPSSQFATRVWWALRCCGHDDVRVLDGGWRRWLAEGRPVETGTASNPPRRFTARPRPELRVEAEDVAAMLGDPGTVLLDARDTAQYSGAVRRGSRGGHIPGARSLPRERVVNEDGTFRSDEELAGLLGAAGALDARRVVAYCNGGVAATNLLFALSILGKQNWTNYDGSWNEWSERHELPVEASNQDAPPA